MAAVQKIVANNMTIVVPGFVRAKIGNSIADCFVEQFDKTSSQFICKRAERLQMAPDYRCAGICRTPQPDRRILNALRYEGGATVEKLSPSAIVERLCVLRAKNVIKSGMSLDQMSKALRHYRSGDIFIVLEKNFADTDLFKGNFPPLEQATLELNKDTDEPEVDDVDLYAQPGQPHSDPMAVIESERRKLLDKDLARKPVAMEERFFSRLQALLEEGHQTEAFLPKLPQSGQGSSSSGRSRY